MQRWRVGANPLKHYFFGPGSAGCRDRPICSAPGGGSAFLPGGDKDGWLLSNSSGRPPLLTFAVQPELAIAIKTAADTAMMSISEWLRRTSIAGCRAQGIDPAEFCEASHVE
jgi:hypothetical protein